MLSIVATALLSTVLPAQSPAPAEPPPFELRGKTGDVELWLVPAAQIVARAEAVGARDLSGAPPATPIQQRTRFGFDAGVGDVLSLRLRVQDARFWGGEVVPSGRPDDPSRFGVAPVDLELFEGFFALQTGGIEVRVGRQIIHLDRGRLVGEAPWAMKSRAFDAVRGIWRLDRHELTAFTALVQDADAPAGALAPLSDRWLVGGHGRVVLVDEFVAHPVLLIDTHSGLEQLRWTLGALVDGDVGALRYELEGYYQGADDVAGLSNGFFAGADVSYGFKPMLAEPRIGGRAYVSSGDSDRSSTLGFSTFDSPFGSRHWPFGIADMFTNMPVHTRDQGLIDLAPVFSVVGGPFRAEAAFHLFSAVAPENTVASPLYGFEPDVIGAMRLGRHFELQAGAALFVPLGPALGRGTQVMPWTYLMVNAQL